MPEIKVPEVKLHLKTPDVKFGDVKLPEGLRDMTREDIQKAVGDIRLPKVDLPTAASIGKELEKALPRRPGPSPLPFVFLGMLGGLFVGLLLATAPATAPRINALVEDLRSRLGDRRTDDGEDEDAWTSQPATGAAGVSVGPGRTSGSSAPADGFTAPTESAGTGRY